ncbi:MAG: PQ-loop domain-containing transporter [Mycoplasmoidaceae bacterium]|nr:PQ-loop domain-containing transporter [Mycoplasmoidaceae bacterium]
MPQLINIIKTKNTTGVPLAMYIILAIGGLCFVISVIGQLAQLKVAALSAALPVLIANAISFGTAIAILIFKFLNKH